MSFYSAQNQKLAHFYLIRPSHIVLGSIYDNAFLGFQTHYHYHSRNMINICVKNNNPQVVARWLTQNWSNSYTDTWLSPSAIQSWLIVAACSPRVCSVNCCSHCNCRHWVFVICTKSFILIVRNSFYSFLLFLSFTFFQKNAIPLGVLTL